MENKYIPECLICFNNIHKSPYIVCSECDAYIHKKCYFNWISFSKNSNNQCIHCQNINCLTFYNEGCFKKYFKGCFKGCFKGMF